MRPVHGSCWNGPQTFKGQTWVGMELAEGNVLSPEDRTSPQSSSIQDQSVDASSCPSNHQAEVDTEYQTCNDCSVLSLKSVLELNRLRALGYISI